MKKTIFVILTVAVFFILFFNSKNKFYRADSNLKSDSDVAVISQKKSLFKQVQNYAGLEKPRLSENEKQSNCRRTLEDIDVLPLKTLVYDLTSGKLKLDANCINLQIKSPFHQGFPEICQTLVNGEPSDACKIKLFFYKAFRIHRATSNEDLHNLTTEVLIQKFFGILTDPQDILHSITVVKEVGAEIYKRLPDSESAGKAAVIGYVLDDKLSADDQVKRSELLKELQQKFPDNEEIFELFLFDMRNTENFKQKLIDHNNSYPNSAVGIYYLGCADWEESNFKSAILNFKRASEMAPNDVRMADTYKKSLETQKIKKICSLNILLSPENF